MNNEVVISIKDDTKDSRFSSVNVTENAMESATVTKTQVNNKGGSKGGNAAKAVGSNLINQATGGKVGQAAGYLETLSNPTTIALTALTIATAAYTMYQEREKRNQQVANLAIRAGATGSVNVINRRTNIMTGKLTGGTGTYIRR